MPRPTTHSRPEVRVPPTADIPPDPLVWFLGAPPVTSEVFAGVRERLGRGDLVPLLDENPLPWPLLVERLAARIEEAGRPVLLVAHGLAVPVALRTRPAALILTNGPVTRVDPVSRAMGTVGRYAPMVLNELLRPRVWLAWLRSSAGLRRAVANPYVMDRDTVAALAASSVATPLARAAVGRFLVSLVDTPPERAVPAVPCLVAWGDEDSLYPSSEADFLESSTPLATRVGLPGGRFVHPVERPWALAALIEAYLSDSFRGASAATSMSRAGWGNAGDRTPRGK